MLYIKDGVIFQNHMYKFNYVQSILKREIVTQTVLDHRPKCVEISMCIHVNK